MYIDNEVFERWMKKLNGSVSEMGKDLKSLINTNEVFDKNEKLLDNQDLCFMLHMSKQTLQRYRGDRLSVSGLVDNIVSHHIELYGDDINRIYDENSRKPIKKKQ